MPNIKLTRDGSQYSYKIRNTTFQIWKNWERDSSWYGEWMIQDERDPFGYSDPISTLKQCREALADMEENPDLYGIK